MDTSLQEIIKILRRAGLPDVADAAQNSLPDPVDRQTLDRFCAQHGLSKGSLTDRLVGRKDYATMAPSPGMRHC